jgi:hypothetical protein
MGRASELRWANDHVSEETLQWRWLLNQPHSNNREPKLSGACLPYYFPGQARLRRYVGVTSLLPLALRQHRRQGVSKRNTSVPCSCEGAGQWACTIPASTPTTVLRVSSTHQFFHSARKVEIPQSKPQRRNGAFIPSRKRRRDFPHRIVKNISATSRRLSL